MTLRAWLKANGDEVKTAASIVQALAVLGAAVAAVYSFILSPKVEERERVRNSIPLLEKASAAEFHEARNRYSELQLVLMSAEMAGAYSRNPDYRSVHELSKLESAMGQTLVRLAGYYETMQHCIAARICSEEFSRHVLCRDATQMRADIAHIQEVFATRYKREKFDTMEPFAKDRERMYASLRGFAMFSDGCSRWNEIHPKDPVAVSKGFRRAPL